MTTYDYFSPFRVIVDIIDWIELNIREPMTVSDVAARAGYSKWHFQRMFKDYTDIPLQTYIRRRKLTQVLLLLPTSPGTISEVGSAFGFHNGHTFSRMFRQQFGLSPTQARRGYLPPHDTLQEKASVKVWNQD